MARVTHRRRRVRLVGLASSGHFLSDVYLLAFPPLFPRLVDEFELTNTEPGLIVALVYLATTVPQVPLGWRVPPGRLRAAGRGEHGRKRGSERQTHTFAGYAGSGTGPLAAGGLGILTGGGRRW